MSCAGGVWALDARRFWCVYLFTWLSLARYGTLVNKETSLERHKFSWETFFDNLFSYLCCKPIFE